MRIVSGPGAAGWRRLAEPGSYECWYFDAMSEDGATAIVLMWFAALPFCPDYLTAYERGQRPKPLDHVALFAAIYHNGKQVCYALNRYDASAFAATTERLEVAIGPNRLVSRGDPNALVIDMHLELPVLAGGERLAGDLNFSPTVDPHALDFGHGDASSDHVWNPVAPDCTVTGSLELYGSKRDRRWQEPFRGRGYHDHNYGSRPLTEGIRHWHRGRAHLEDATLVYYHMEPMVGSPMSLLAALEPGRQALVTEGADFLTSAWRRRILCPRFPGAIKAGAGDGSSRIAIAGRVRSIIDWGPFYMRFLMDFSARVGPDRTLVGVGISEYFDSRGLRNSLYRPLIKTRIHRVTSSPAVL